ncbi:MAG TPA: penicillin acylase family protein [Bryobacteraceae bacterium]|nr:penicillin acylase family protein [Bryobacteraceae bacterium]
MPFGRFLKYINLSIAVLLVAGLFATYWTAYRPLPQTSGQITAPVSARATVSRDAIGVPHITAANWEDAIFLQGFVTAQDRLWQMDALRRLAAGELSEVVGPSALDLDREARRLRMRRLAEDHYRTLPAADRVVLAAYARGVNYFIETHRGRLPLEFTILRYDPRPWSATDSILCGLQMYRNLTSTWKDEVQKQAMLEGGDPAKVNFLFPSRIGTEFQPGSNAWALSGKLTASGKPILANDPHLEWGIPSTWYQVHLKAPGLDVIGVSLPGVPCVIIGHNQRIAWGVTNLGYDVQDLYIEKIDPGSGRYLFRGQVEQARAESEWIAVKGGRPVEFHQWVTRHGPLSVSEGNRLLALRWSAAEPGAFQFPFLDLNRARNWQEFTAAVARFPGPGQNFVYADVDGNIGYHASGLLPIRNNYDGDVPVDGSSGEYEWQGFIPFDQLPSFYNPPQGWIVTANQNPFPENYPYRVHGNFAPPYRSLEIRSGLAAHRGWKPDQILAVQKDVYSAFLHFLARQVVAACDRAKPPKSDFADAIALLRSWNGQVEKQTPAPMLVSLIYLELRKRIAESSSPGKSGLYSPQIAPAVVEKILRNDAQGWFQDRDGLLIRALADAIQAGRRDQGSNVKRWDYGKYNQLTIRHPVGGRLPLVGAYFNIGPVEMSGASTSIKQTTEALGPSMRFVADFSDWDHSLNNITIGQSGQVLSAHYKDQWDAYYSGRSFPMQFEHVEAKATLVIQPK